MSKPPRRNTALAWISRVAAIAAALFALAGDEVLAQFQPQTWVLRGVTVVAEAIVAEADRIGLPVYAHATHPEEMLAVVEAGVDVLAHSLDLVEAVPDALIAAVAGRRPYFSPTLVLKESMFRFQQHPETLEEPFLRNRLPPRMRDALADSTMGARFVAFRSELTARDGVAWSRENFARSLETTRALLDAGAIALVGTDPVWYVVPGYDVHREMELMVEAGAEPLEVLRAATLYAARALRRDADYGSVESGKRADLVILRANPLRDITNARRIDLVIKGGQPLDPDTLLARLGAGN